jgi:predicted alpha/beta superfamily hydrolase
MRHALFALVLLCLAAGFAGAGEPIIIGETITLPSKIMGEERTILVSTPPGYEESSGGYPVLYMTDGNGHFTHTRGTVDFLARNGVIPQLIIVAVANTDRARDLSPTHVASTTVDGRVFESPTSGGAPKFLDFFERELFPYIDSHYPTLPMRLFSGHSFGGLFALNAIFTRPEMFDAVLAVSPSLNWDDELPIRQASTFFDDREEFNATLFVAMADEEEGDPRPNRLDRLEEALQGSESAGFEWQVMRMPDENHGTVVLRAHYWGLRKVFDGWRLPPNPETGRFDGGLDDVKSHYAGLSERYGFTVVPEENQLNNLGYQILGREDFAGAIEVFRYNVELYPDSANVYDSLGDGLVAASRLEEALASYSKAVENATELGDENLPIFATNRDRVKEQLDQAKTE